jgi:dipeptidyl aminopeptidase/acylaminoacyl peptidase
MNNIVADASENSVVDPADRHGADMLARYRAAEAVLDASVMRLVLNESIRPTWIGGSAFWYRRERPDGGEYVWVEGGQARPAFDHAAAARALEAATGTTVGPQALIAEAIGAEEEPILHHDGRRWRFSGGVVQDLGPTKGPMPGFLLSPTGDRALVVRGHDLAVVEIADGSERLLTDDGEENFAWGKYPDAALLAIARRRANIPLMPFGWSWSPDGKFVIGGRVDERHIAPYPFLESVPQDGGARPHAYDVRQALVGERGPILSVCAIEIATGRRIPIDLDGFGDGLVHIEPLDWSADNRRVFIIAASDETSSVALLEIDIASGAIRPLIVESITGYRKLGAELYKQPNSRIIAGGRQAIWYSERTGFGHLYLYDLATGNLIYSTTTGDWPVRDVLKIDEDQGRVYFTASGREPGDPYQRRVYRVDLDGQNLTLLSPEVADHTVDGPPEALLARIFGLPRPASAFSPDSSVFVDCWSTISTPSVSVLRSTEDGSIVLPLETADASALYATGWRAPEPFVAKAADGVTDLYGAIYRPGVAADGAAPVITAIYGGPQLVVAPHNFAASRFGVGYYGRSAFAALGFAVVVVDGRGTPLRSKAFQDAGYDRGGDVCVDDHAAVLKQLCDRDPTLDANRIGVYGHSAGGYTSARAILRHPDIFKVAFSSAGAHNFHGLYYAGGGPLPDYGNGIRLKPEVAAVPENYRDLDNGTLAANLRGKLLLAYGDMDENAFPAVTLQFCAALNEANRSYDLLYIPNGTHFYLGQPYFLRRLWDYFVEHLMHETPPLNYAIGQGGMSAFA